MTDLGDYPEPPMRRATGEHPPVRTNGLLLKVVAAVLAALCVAAITWAVTQAASCSTVKVVDKFVPVETFNARMEKNDEDHTKILNTINANQQAILERLPLPAAKRKSKQ